MVPADADDVVGQYRILLNELEQFNPELLDKGRILAVSKCDMLDEELMQELKATIDLDIPVVFISAQAQNGIQELKDIIWKEIHR
jgi:GTPase